MGIESVSLEDDVPESLVRLEELIEKKQIAEAETLLDEFGPSNRLIVLSRLPRDVRRELFVGLSAEKVANYLHDIPEVQALSLLEKLQPGRAADILEELPKDEQADLVG